MVHLRKAINKEGNSGTTAVSTFTKDTKGNNLNYAINGQKPKKRRLFTEPNSPAVEQKNHQFSVTSQNLESQLHSLNKELIG